MRQVKKPFYLGLLLLCTAQVLVGSNIVFSKFVLTSIPILLLLILRFAFAAAVLFPLHWLTAARRLPLRHHFAQLQKKDWLFILAQSLTAGFLFNCFMLLGLSYTDANVAGIITSALPAIIAVMSWVILGEKISAKKSFCVLFATGGLLIIASDKLLGNTVKHSFLGDFFVFISLLPEATYYVLCKLHANRLPVFLTSSLLNGISMMMLILLLPFTSWQACAISLQDWFIIFILGLSSGLFYVCWFFGSQWVDGIMASLSTAVMPVAAVVMAWLLLGESLSVLEFTGMSLVLFSIIIYAKR